MGASEGGVTQHRVVNSADSVTSLGDSRADSAAGPSRVLKPIITHNNKKCINSPKKLLTKIDACDKMITV